MTDDLITWLRAALVDDERVRRILDLHQPNQVGAFTDLYCRECEGADPCETIRLLAQPYAGRPGWRAEWGS